MRKNLVIVILLLLVCYLAYQYITLESNQPFNEIKSSYINWSKEWKKTDTGYTTTIPGSRFQFTLKGTRSIAFHLHSLDDTGQIALHIAVDRNSYQLINPNSNEQTLVLSLTGDKNATHAITGTYYCYRGLVECTATLDKLVLLGGAIIPSPPTAKGTLAIIGDSISLVGLDKNYSALLAEQSHMQLYNSAYWGRTVSRDNGKFPAVDYYKDILAYVPEKIIIFLGINDVHNHTGIIRFQADYAELIKQVKTKLPHAKIISVGILPGKQVMDDASDIDAFNTVIMTIDQKEQIAFLDPSDWLTAEDYGDQVHPNNSGEIKIFQQLNKVLY